MKRIPFLNPEEIEKVKQQEEQSNKAQKRTPEQIEAIYASGQNILVSASAGSGKTFVMVQRIIDQILRGVEVSELFISTFTVKAATELKERLERELSQALKNATINEEKHHLAKQIADLSNADIGTMDAFTQKLLNQYGYLLDIVPNFRILQNASEQAILQNEVFSAVFEAFYEKKDAHLFKKLVKNFTGKAKNISGFRQQVYRIYSFLQSTSDPMKWLDETFLVGYESLNMELEKEKLIAQVKEALFDNEIFFRHHLDNEGKEFSGAKYLENVTALVERLSLLQEMSTTDDYECALKDVVEMSRASNGRALTNSSRKAELKELAASYNQEKNENIQTLRQLENQVFQFDYQVRYHQEAQEILEELRLFLTAFVEAYLKRKKEENAFEFSDISHFAIQILEKFPQVRAYYQDKYHEVMVDEYQDTNHIQEKMLDLLSNGKNRFMVGDIKQSIYRFRQADPQIFNEKFKAYQAGSQDGKLIVLKENFRSHVEVLDTTNAVFRHLMDEEVGEIDYNQTHYLVAGNPQKKREIPAYQTEFLLYDSSDVTEESEGVEEKPVISAGEIGLVIKEIIRLHNEEGVAFEDITLLTASRTRNDVILSEFAKYEIPLITDGGEDNYLQSVEIMVMLDTLRTINNPLNDYALVALLKSPMFKFTEDELARIALQKQETKSQENFYEKYLNALKTKGQHPELITSHLKEKMEQFYQTLQDWRQFSKTHSLYDLIWKIYQDRFYYDYVGKLPNGAGRQANLYALSLRANDYEKTSFKGLSRFIGMIDRILANQNDLASVHMAAPKDAVHLMTIHKSKGLEFKYVFILHMDKAFNRQDTNSAIILSRKNGIGIKYIAQLPLEEKESATLHQVRVSIDTLPYQANEREIHLASLSEQMRLLYVAMTRAERKLYLIGKGRQDKFEKLEFLPAEHQRLAILDRQKMSSFQEWLWAIQLVFEQENLAYTTRFVTDKELTVEAIGHLQLHASFREKEEWHDFHTDLRNALDSLEKVERINQEYQAAIDLPTVRTPSQIKKLYEPIMETEGVEVMEEVYVQQEKALQFELPVIGKTRVTSAQIGSVLHELMQRIPLEAPMTTHVIRQALAQVHADEAVKKRIEIAKVSQFFTTELGQRLLQHPDKVHREAPFAMLKEDPVSKEQFVVRGILDGYLRFEDHIVLFDYKTDHYTDSSLLQRRYQEQMSLYAEALKKAYAVTTIEKYLILLGGKEIEVVKVE